MESETMQTELITFFRLLVDETRLKIIGLLAQKAASVEQLAALLKLRPSLVSHHLDKLVMLPFSPLHPQHIVEQKLIMVGGGKSFQG